LKKTYLNLGCGSRWHPDWVNIDIAPRDPAVIRHDLSRGIPLADESCDVVYHAAVLEHLRRQEAAALLSECYRVMKPGGILRVGVPDLEKICRLYLLKLSEALEGDGAAVHDYDWIMLELLDQVARERSGGDMLDYLRQDPLPNERFVYERIGVEGEELVEALRASGASQNSPPFLCRLRRIPAFVKQNMVSWLSGIKGRRAYKIGRFRLTGEAHHWMYDRYSLARLLRLAGFIDPQLRDAHTSGIPDWDSFHLDTLPDGRVIKPDLFFMEVIKPGESIDD